MAAPRGRRLIPIALALGLAVSSVLARPAGAVAAGCPARPWTLADIASVPSLWGAILWPPESDRRVACFGDARISFVVRGGMLMSAFSGVAIAPAFGQSIYFNTHDVASTDGWDLNAWVPPSLTMGPEDRKALAMTSPGLGLDGWHDVWWRGSGHFDDPAAAACRPDDGTSTIDGVPIVRTPAEAVELCRNEFVIDRLVWLSVPPTDTVTNQQAAGPGVPVMPFAGALAVLAFVAVLAWPRRSNRAG